MPDLYDCGCIPAEEILCGDAALHVHAMRSVLYRLEGLDKAANPGRATELEMEDIRHLHWLRLHYEGQDHQEIPDEDYDAPPEIYEGCFDDDPTYADGRY